MTRAAALAIVLALMRAPAADAADMARGMQVYRIHCSACHGANGVAVVPTAPNFARGERLLQPDAQLLAFVRAGRGPMPGFFGILSDREMLDVIAYLRTLR